MQGYRVCCFKRIRLCLAALVCAALLASGCGGVGEETEIEIADAIGGSSILTAADLLAFLERGESDVARFFADISLEGEMLRITKARDGITLDGNGFTLSGSGDCVLRLDAGCSVRLQNITIHSGADAIGCLGNASIGGEGVRLIGVGNGLRAEGEVVILAGSSIESEANVGMGFAASGLTLQNGASLSAKGPMGGVNVSGGILLSPRARLAAYTEEHYNALKCGGTLSLEDGATLVAQNLGAYHGAEVTALRVQGAVTIEAKGGKNYSGLFLFEQLENITVIGRCEPKARFEKGKGSISFVDSAQKLPAAQPSPEPGDGLPGPVE